MTNVTPLHKAQREVERDALLYVTAYIDHLNELTPEFPVLKRRVEIFTTPARPRISRRDLLEGPVEGVTPMEPPEGLEEWEYWQCDWTDEHLKAMNVNVEYIIEDAYIDQMPDAWNMNGVLVNRKAREAYEKHAPDTCLFFPATLYSKNTGKTLDLERWILCTRHWLFLMGEERPQPHLDFSSHIIRPPVGRAIQEDAKVAEAIDRLGIFSIPGNTPNYSQEVFTKLKSEGLTGLKEKTSDSITFHEMREVIGHVWRI